MEQNPSNGSIRNVHELALVNGENDQQVNVAESDRANSGNNREYPVHRGIFRRRVDLVTNGINLFSEQDWKLQTYYIYFYPNVETNIKKEILNKHISLLGKYFLDGNTMHTFVKYRPKDFTLRGSGSSGLSVTITIIHKCEVEGFGVTKILFKFLHSQLRHLNYIQVGNNFYDPETTITNNRLGVKYWEGYSIGVRLFNNKLRLCIVVSDRFTPAQTVLDFLNVSCGNNRFRFPCLMNNFKAVVIGTVVLTLYNNELYKIHDVDENLNIYSTFINEDGSKISYKDYYKQKWTITILDDKQPMLKTTDHDGCTLYLVPELCAITGFTDIIGNKHLVKEVSQYTNDGPNTTIIKCNQFIRKLSCTKKFIEALHSWDLNLGRQLIRKSGRLLFPLNLKCLNRTIPVNDQGDWTDQLQLLKMLETPFIKDWVVLAPSKYNKKLEKFVNVLRLTTGRMAFHLPEPKIVQINDESERSYMNYLDEIVKTNPHFILCVIKSLNSDLYSQINRKLCFEASVPFQLMSLKQVRTNDLSTHTNTAIQINCKLGGVPWSIANMEDENIMNTLAVGLDMYQNPLIKNKYFCAVMVSKNGCFTRYFSYVDLLCKENISEFYISSIADALGKYKDLNRKSPRRILIYKAGSNENCASEINLMKEKCVEFFDEGRVPFAFISVQKFENTIKLFTQHGPYNYQNPLPGTIVDSDISNLHIIDFFLISHTVESGLVSPTNYHVLYNSIPQFMVSELQMITYMLTHLFYKTLHTIQVPAPCQLAYDLAYFSANTLKSTKNILLHGNPFFF